jgi:hypothetical protein
MPPTLKKPRQWLLTVVSAGALLPGCAQERDVAGDESSDEEERGVGPRPGVVVPPDGWLPVPDAGHWLGNVVNPIGAGTMVHPDAGRFPPPVGVVIVPVEGPLDAGVADAAVADAAVAGDAGTDAGSKDAGCKVPVLINGIVVAPPDASCMTPLYPGIMPRNVDGD